MVLTNYGEIWLVNEEKGNEWGEVDGIGGLKRELNGSWKDGSPETRPRLEMDFKEDVIIEWELHDDIFILVGSCRWS